MDKAFLPTTMHDLISRGWKELDIIIVTGDAYVYHPSYGAAMIGRALEKNGFRVGIISQPGRRSRDDIHSLGRPRLFFGITAGNLDSMVANYTANRKPRSEDEYSPGGLSGLRPDRATIFYTNMARQAFPGTAIVIGGIEASLRRLAHYDYWSDKVRRSILLDSKADMLVYGMGELQTLEIARRLSSGEEIRDIDDIRGTVIVKKSIEHMRDFIRIPSYEETAADKHLFNEAFRKTYEEQDPFRGRTIVQKHGERFVVQLPPARPLEPPEMDDLYDAGFAMMPHPSYGKRGIPGFETVRWSVTSHRGCPGECGFCSLYMHQGRIVQSRTSGSILDEIKKLASQKDFKGTITDIGGPTANLYGAECESWKSRGACRTKRCLIPARCAEMKTGYNKTIELWRKAAKIPGVKKTFIGSGVRYDILTEKDSDDYLRTLCRDHISGRLKVAPEHTEKHVLELMGKGSFDTYKKFVKRFAEMNKSVGKKQYLVNYIITGHPGSTLEDALNLALELKKLGIHPEQIQDYLPIPMTSSAAMYYTGSDPFTGKTVFVAKNPRERKLQRSLVQYSQPANKRYVIEALRNLGRLDLASELFGG